MSKKNLVENTGIQIHYPLEVYQKIMHWVKKSPYEISGFGNVEYDKKNKVFTVTDVFLVKQVNGPTSTETDEADLGKLMIEQHKASGEGSTKLWWHSHANMGVFWSGTDKDTILKYGGNGYIIATVFNKREEMKSAVCFKTKHALFGDATSFIDDVDTYYLHPADWDTSYDEKITEHSRALAKSNTTKTSGVSSIIDRSNQEWDYDLKCWVDKSSKRPVSLFHDDNEQLELAGQLTPTKWINGLLGKGIAAEAEALRMSSESYVKFLNKAGEEELNDKENELTMLEAAGMFEPDELDGADMHERFSRSNRGGSDV